MTPRRFYQMAVWLPIIVPALTVGGLALFGMPDVDVLAAPAAVLMFSLMLGGIPYTALALWAVWWMRRRHEAEIRRLALRAPLLMLLTFGAFAFAVSARDGADVMWGALKLWGLGTIYIVPLGYAYVGLVFLLRALGGRIGWIDGGAPPPSPGGAPASTPAPAR